MYIESANFAIWCDFIERSFLDGEFMELIEAKTFNGATSNPAIFKSAFLTSPAYKADKESLKGKSAKEVYEALAVEDIKRAAQKLHPLHVKGDDGFISIEVDPFLCDDAQGTIEEGKRLYATINMPNVMIKVPATRAGFVAMEALIAEGINVNATLIFSPEQSLGCLKAFEAGSKVFHKAHPEAALPQAVISVFVSRFDRKVDAAMRAAGLEEGRVGIMNAAKIYNQIQAYGLSNVRCLFASTGVKGDALAADYYVRELLYPNAVNTAPLDTIKAFVSNGEAVVQNVLDEEEINAFFATVSNVGISMEKVYEELMQEGVVAFNDAFKEILDDLN